MSSTTNILRLHVLSGLLLAAAGAASADTITLRPSVRVAPGAEFTLAEVAGLDGDAARALAGIVIGTGEQGAFELGADRIRQKLSVRSQTFISRVLFPTLVALRRMTHHSSRMRVTAHLQQPTRRLERAALPRAFTLIASLHGLAPSGVYLATFVTKRAVGSYPTISPLPAVRPAVSFCCTFLEVSLTGRYPALCSTELGLSSRVLPHQRSSVHQRRRTASRSRGQTQRGLPAPKRLSKLSTRQTAQSRLRLNATLRSVT